MAFIIKASCDRLSYLDELDRSFFLVYVQLPYRKTVEAMRKRYNIKGMLCLIVLCDAFVFSYTSVLCEGSSCTVEGLDSRTTGADESLFSF